MKVWLLVSGNKNMVVDRVDDDSFSIWDFNGSVKTDWKSVQFKVVKKRRYQDMVYFASAIPFFNSKSMAVLGDMISGYTQLLDVEVINHDIELKMINVTNVIHAIDYSRSIPERTLRGRVNGFKKLNFLEEKVSNQIIFKTPELSTCVYVTDVFRDLVLSSKLKGFEFIEVWDSEWTEEKEQEEQARYQAFLMELEKSKGNELNWSHAMEIINLGKAAASGEWKIQNDEDGVLHIARLGLDCNYAWMKSAIVPPILFSMKWHEVEKSEL